MFAVDIREPMKVVVFEGISRIDASGYVYKSKTRDAPSVSNAITGQTELIPNLRIPNIDGISGNRLLQQGRYFLVSEENTGFTIFDIIKQKPLTNVPLYSGWKRFGDMVYLERLGKLLVIDNNSDYTIPNATTEHPGASAYTIDINTGAITPYLMTKGRQQRMAEAKAYSELQAYLYTPEGRCATYGDKRKLGQGVINRQNQNFEGIIVGYDCEENAYAIGYREPYNGHFLMRFKLSDDDLRQYNLTESSGFKVCPACNGHPVTYSRETTTGWSDWEQKSLIIYVYTRKWETKTITKEQVCKVCKGEA